MIKMIYFPQKSLSTKQDLPDIYLIFRPDYICIKQNIILLLLIVITKLSNANKL